MKRFFPLIPLNVSNQKNNFLLSAEETIFFIARFLFLEAYFLCKRKGFSFSGTLAPTNSAF